MPLDPVPPSSPRGNLPPTPPKDRYNCKDASRMCDIPISQIGRRYHYVPRRLSNTVFLPPAIPTWVLRHLKAHPPTWTWTIRAGPRAGTTLTVPTVPIHCSGDSHRAVKWIVSVFHSFKNSLHCSSETDSGTDGKLRPQLVRIYQNNMLMHIRAQMGVLERSSPPPKPARPPPSPPGSIPPSKTTHPPNNAHSSCLAEIAALRAEIAELTSGN